MTTEHTHLSHMPLDTEIHWHWRNPLNVIPATVVALSLLSIITFFVS